MSRLKLIILLLMLALVPLRAFTAVAVGDCAIGQHGAAHVHDHGGSAHSHDEPQHDHEHCAGASFVSSVSAFPLAVPASSARMEQRRPHLVGFVADHLDPPPLIV